jgi:hypothetical protein
MSAIRRATFSPIFLAVVACSAAPDDGTSPAWPKHRWVPAEPSKCVPTEDAISDLATQAGAPPPSISQSAFDAFGGRIEADPARLAPLGNLLESPQTLACFAGTLARRADLAVHSDHPRVALIADAAASLDVSLDVGGPFADVDGETRSRLATLPPGLGGAVARILAASDEAADLRDRAFESLPLETLFADAARVWLGWDFSDPGKKPVFDPGLDTDAYERSDGKAGLLYRGAARIAQAIDETNWTAVERLPAGFHTTIRSRGGLVILRGGGRDTYDPEVDPELREPAFLVIDTGGDDIYRIPAGATTSASHPVSVLVDLGGNDEYGYVERHDGTAGLAGADSDGRYQGQDRGPFSLSRTGRQGSGTLGYGFLVDLGGGDDSYRSLRMSQGFAAFGVGMLWDDGGDDVYDAEAGSQASALGGIGLLVDLGGDDRYRSYSMSQAFAGSSSSSLLFDSDGSDRYELVPDGVVLVGSSQTDGATNLSLGQGTAMGWRDPDEDLHLGGGVAVLRDVRGNDVYSGGTFAQGTGYWMGLGVLSDGEGNDTYDALFYGQGAAAHFAAAAFLEGGGDDRYGLERDPIQSALGLGHDFSMGVFVDAAGDDRYRVPAFGAGATTCRGIGIFVDSKGSDVYDPIALSTLGAAADTCSNGEIRQGWGIFVDADGIDRYTARGHDDTSWFAPSVSGAPWFAVGTDGRSLDVKTLERAVPGFLR